MSSVVVLGPSKKKKKTTSVKKKAPKKKEVKNVDSEAGEETDEGDMESQEMDYFSSESNNSEDERVSPLNSNR
jgi:hypothetical protein